MTVKSSSHEKHIQCVGSRVRFYLKEQLASKYVLHVKNVTVHFNVYCIIAFYSVIDWVHPNSHYIIFIIFCIIS